MAEGRGPVGCLVERSRFATHSLFVTETVARSLSATLEVLDPAVPVYVASQQTFDGVVGFHLHRGCLAAGLREARPRELVLPPADALASLVVVLEDLTNHDNLGGVFRNAHAFGADAVLLNPRCCDPLYRRAIRVSLGASLSVPFARLESWPAALKTLRERGYRVVAMHPGGGESEGPARRWAAAPRVALLLGTEGAGLSDAALAQADLRVRIPMVEGIDSINVASASAIAMASFFDRHSGDLVRW